MNGVEILTKGEITELSRASGLLKDIIAATGFLCKGVHNRFGPRAIGHTDFIFYIKDDRSNILGFALVNDHPTFLYIDLICAKGVGKLLLDSIETKATEMRKSSVILCSLKDPYSFYRLKGYEKLDWCRPELTWKGHIAEKRDDWEMSVDFNRETKEHVYGRVSGCGVKEDECILMEKILPAPSALRPVRRRSSTTKQPMTTEQKGFNRYKERFRSHLDPPSVAKQMKRRRSERLRK